MNEELRTAVIHLRLIEYAQDRGIVVPVINNDLSGHRDALSEMVKDMESSEHYRDDVYEYCNDVGGDE